MKKLKRLACALLVLAVFAGVMPQTTAMAKAVLAAPKAVKAAKITGTISVTWNEVKGAKGYMVYRSVNDGKFKKVATKKENLYEEEDSFKDGTKLSYYVKAYKKVDGKNTAGSKSKKVKWTVSNKDKYAKIRKIVNEYALANGAESPKGTFTVVSMPNVLSLSEIYGVSTVVDSESAAFSAITAGENNFASLMLTYAPNTDPCLVYTYVTEDGDAATAMIFFNPSKITKDTKFKKSNCYEYEDETDGDFDHMAQINESFDNLMEYINEACAQIEGASLSKLGFKNYK